MLLSQLQLLVPDLPELCEFFFILFDVGSLLLLPFNLKSPRAVNCLLHFELAALLFLVQTISFVLSLGHLLIKHLLLVIFEGTELLHLAVNHFLSNLKLISCALLNGIHSHIVHFELLPGELLNPSFLE